MSPSKKPKKTRKIILLIIAVLFAVTVSILFKLSGGVLVFSYLKPTYLPPGVSIKAARISANSTDVFTELNFRTEDWVYHIQQSKANTIALPEAKNNYDPTSINFTCSLFVSPQQRQYRLCHSVDYGEISRYEVTQIEGSTRITSSIPTTTSTTIDTEDIGKFVDSFKWTPKLFTPTFRRDGA